MAAMEDGSTLNEGTEVWRDQYESHRSGAFRPAVVLLACEYPNNMQSDIPLVLHSLADIPIINYNVDAALALQPSQILVTTAREHIEAIQQVVQKAHPQASCAISFVGVDRPGEGGGDITRKQRQEALKALQDDSTEVVEWPCHWRITQRVAQALMARGREELDKSGAGCYSLNPSPDYVPREEPHLLWATAAFWKGPLQGHPCRSSGHHYGRFYENGIGPPMVITNRSTLSEAEQALSCLELMRHQQAGVTFRDNPLMIHYGTFLSAGLQIGRDTIIGVGVQIYGKTVIGRNVRIEGPTVIKDSVIGDNCRIGAFSHLEQATLASGSGVGPFARLRAGAAIDSGAYIGNFVELKGAHVGQGGNVCHLSYLGDADVGDHANIGAGTITCNYNGVAKNRTSIAADAFIGSNSTLVAPVTIGHGALIAAGSVITTDVPADALALGRSRQTTKEHKATATRKKLGMQEQQKKERLG